MNSTVFRGKVLSALLVLALMFPIAASAGRWGLPIPPDCYYSSVEQMLLGGCYPKRSDAVSALAERRVAVALSQGVRPDSAHSPEMQLLLSEPQNCLVKVSWSPLRLISGGRIVAYSLLGYEYLRLDVRKGVSNTLIDTRQLLSGIYVVRLETLDGQTLAHARLVVDHPSGTPMRN